MKLFGRKGVKMDKKQEEAWDNGRMRQWEAEIDKRQQDIDQKLQSCNPESLSIKSC